MSGAGFQLETRPPDTVAVSGTLSFATAAAALAALDAAVAGTEDCRHLDLSALDGCDSAGLACVLAVLAGASGRGQSVRVRHAPSGLLALAQVCGVASMVA